MNEGRSVIESRIEAVGQGQISESGEWDIEFYE